MYYEAIEASYNILYVWVTCVPMHKNNLEGYIPKILIVFSAVRCDSSLYLSII